MSSSDYLVKDSLSKETKLVPTPCAELSVGDLIVTVRPCDTALVLDIKVGTEVTVIKFGSYLSHSVTEFSNKHRLIRVVKDTLN